MGKVRGIIVLKLIISIMETLKHTERLEKLAYYKHFH